MGGHVPLPPWLRYCGSACRRHWSIVQHSVWWANVGGVMLSADKLIRRPAAVLDCSTFFQDRISLPVAHLPSLTSKLTAEHFALMATFSFWCFEFWRLSRSYNCTDKILTAEFGLVQCFPYSRLQTILQFTFWQIFAKGIAVLFVSTAVLTTLPVTCVQRTSPQVFHWTATVIKRLLLDWYECYWQLQVTAAWHCECVRLAAAHCGTATKCHRLIVFVYFKLSVYKHHNNSSIDYIKPAACCLNTGFYPCTFHWAVNFLKCAFRHWVCISRHPLKR